MPELSADGKMLRWVGDDDRPRGHRSAELPCWEVGCNAWFEPGTGWLSTFGFIGQDDSYDESVIWFCPEHSVDD